MRCFLLIPVLLFLAPAAHAARVDVVLPANAALRVVDRTPPAEGPRIDCPGVCTYEVPGRQLDLFDLRVTVLPDPRIGDEPWDIVAMPGCKGTSALPAPSALCVLPSRGNAKVGFTLRYRPVLAVTVGGTIAGDLAAIYITGTPGVGYQGAGASFSCNLADLRTEQCARHLSAAQPVEIRAPSTDLALFVSAGLPCGSADCAFTLEEDTCVPYLYLHNRPPGFPEKTISGPECPTGPGIGGGGGGDPPPELQTYKDLALAQMRKDLEQALYPCLTATTGLSIFFSVGPTIGPVVGGTMLAAAGPQCVSLVNRLTDLSKIYEDPPDFDFHRIAPIPRSARTALPLPSCKGLASDEKRACTKVSAALRAYAKKVDKATAVVASLRVTFERASGAHLAGDDKGLAKQLHAADLRVKQLEKALAAKARAGEKLAAALADAETTAPITEEQYTEAAEAVIAALALAGVDEASARAALEPALAPKALDLVTVFPAP